MLLSDKPFVIDRGNVQAMKAHSQIGKQRAAQGLEDWNTPEELRGKEVEQCVARLLNTCLQVDQVKRANRGSVLDDEVKVDLLVYVGNEVQGFQVKTSQAAAERFHMEHPEVPCIWYAGTNRLQLCVAIAQLLHTKMKPVVKNALMKFDLLKSKKVSNPSALRNLFSKDEQTVCVVLGLLTERAFSS
jgi:hypothetical protein